MSFLSLSLSQYASHMHVERTPRNFRKRVLGGPRLPVAQQGAAVDIVSVPAPDAGPCNGSGTPLWRKRNNIVAHQPQHDVPTDVWHLVPMHHAAVAHRVFVLERIERFCRDLVDWKGLAWGGPLPSWCMP